MNALLVLISALVVLAIAIVVLLATLGRWLWWTADPLDDETGAVIHEATKQYSNTEGENTRNRCTS